MKTKLEQINDIVKIQCSDGNWDSNPYMLGMANGLILAQAILEDKEPKYLSEPEVWGKDRYEGMTAVPTEVSDK